MKNKMFKKILIISLIFVSLLTINSFAIPPETVEQFIGKSVVIRYLIPFAEGSHWEVQTQGVVTEMFIITGIYYISLKTSPTKTYKLNLEKITHIRKL